MEDEDCKFTLFDKPIFQTFVHPGEVVEMRAINGKSVMAGYFDDHDAFCEAIHKIKTIGGNIYFTLQVIDPRLLGRAFNRMKQGIATTSDSNVLSYRWLPIDIDPVRPSGVASSDLELQEAFLLREEVITWLRDNMDLTDRPIKAMSGNGYHLLYRLPDIENNKQNIAFIKNILETLDERFNTSKVGIDTKVFNPARIWKLYGTTARKGDQIPASERREARPHRASYIEDIGENGNDNG